MKAFPRLAVSLGVAALVGLGQPAFAAATLQYTLNDGSTRTVSPFGGFDYISNASAVSTAPVFDGSTLITTTYLASANAILDPGGNAFVAFGITPPGGGGIFPDFEFTVKATIQETATCTVFNGTLGICEQALFSATGGTWAIYYDKTADANRVLGTGYLDGLLLLSGTILPGEAGSFLVSYDPTTGLPIGGSGNFTFFGLVGYTQQDCTLDACITPALDGTTAGAEIKIGANTTAWTAPTSWVDGGGIPTGGLIFQADGNQSFTEGARVPEPATLALIGVGLLGMAASRRRRS